MTADGSRKIGNPFARDGGSASNSETNVSNRSKTTALGAAYGAGLATGFWTGLDELRSHWAEDRRYAPAFDAGALDGVTNRMRRHRR